MHHPGPPRFTSVGERIELAPRDPNPDATYEWRLVDAPADSRALLGDGPVVHLAPDVPGTYVAELDAPDGTHAVTVRAFPDPRREARFRVDETDANGDLDGVERATVIGAFNDFTMGVHRAEREGDAWALDVPLPPGEHEAIFVFDDEFERYATAEAVVEGPGRPRVRLDGRRDGDEVVVAATARAAPDGSDPTVEFHLDDRDALGRDDATVYEIFVREFAGESVDATFAEIERRVDYLDWLGVDAVWLTPVCESPTRHGYHITDLFDTASDLGTREEFASLVERLHEADIRVIFDLVINHTSRDHPAFQLHRAGVPDYADRYERVPAERDASGVNWAGDDAPGYYFNWTRIPNLNYDSLAVRRWMLDVIDAWAPLVDGFRCDVAWGVPHGFWKEVRERVKADDPDFLLLDETVPRDSAFRENEFDLHYDTDLYFALRDVGTGDAPAPALFDALADARRRGYPDEAVHMRYVENHDEERYATECGDGSLRAAAAATFTLPGAPLLYYGQERGVPERRGTMRWHDGDAGLTAFHRRLVELRNEQPALRAPSVEPVGHDVAEGDPDRVVAYERASGDDRLVVVLNFGVDPATVTPARPVDTENLFDGTDASDDDGVRVRDVAVLRAR
ncbi:alpha-amylase family glycosyl hydrolase [Halegenticoccus soli]|uniref:alpha-amylase family glycosyl hydrolase n=1 Tax=Halegenticoccus soli TaxID=1985678 RepID=UPI000C6EB37C|nr:alpha-amylase family glycosyl hydrolase [Halegenticoccus soli]